MIMMNHVMRMPPQAVGNDNGEAVVPVVAPPPAALHRFSSGSKSDQDHAPEVPRFPRSLTSSVCSPSCCNGTTTTITTTATIRSADLMFGQTYGTRRTRTSLLMDEDSGHSQPEQEEDVNIRRYMSISRSMQDTSNTILDAYMMAGQANATSSTCMTLSPPQFTSRRSADFIPSTPKRRCSRYDEDEDDNDEDYQLPLFDGKKKQYKRWFSDASKTNHNRSSTLASCCLMGSADSSCPPPPAMARVTQSEDLRAYDRREALRCPQRQRSRENLMQQPNIHAHLNLPPCLPPVPTTTLARATQSEDLRAYYHGRKQSTLTLLPPGRRPSLNTTSTETNKTPNMTEPQEAARDHRIVGGRKVKNSILTNALPKTKFTPQKSPSQECLSVIHSMHTSTALEQDSTVAPELLVDSKHNVRRRSSSSSRVPDEEEQRKSPPVVPYMIIDTTTVPDSLLHSNNTHGSTSRSCSSRRSSISSVSTHTSHGTSSSGSSSISSSSSSGGSSISSKSWCQSPVSERSRTRPLGLALSQPLAMQSERTRSRWCH
ncbi:expressed unknown protein [Seminavis robusta]|uniref:Uncharacterized protein n=1 Tax=Seminavis robusta TaxID=568900 RepID=A0A9N8EP36_9STRA|nr:expressed unknown protein [Seminavis robusta]|eukprot:Sro1428_g271850.1 n/a (543) ;mRNA; f:11258-13018